MKKILNGIQSSGKPHMGNIVGSIIPSIEESKISDAKSMFFIADLHALTTIKDRDILKENIFLVAAAWLACGLDLSKCVLYRQSMIPTVCELAWYLSCFTPYPMLANSHSFKDKAANLSNVNAGLFTYPVLMAADILLYDATDITVGKDQKQHIEIARGIAKAFNLNYNCDAFVIPNALIKENVGTLPGVDGRKMSKSYNNIIDIFADENVLLKNIMSIKTDSKPLNEPKDYESCSIYKLYSTICNDLERNMMAEKYKSTNFGYGEAKKMLFEKILEKFSDQRTLFNYYLANRDEVFDLLHKSEENVRNLARSKIQMIRKIVGYD